MMIWFIGASIAVVTWWVTLPKKVHQELKPLMKMYIKDAKKYGHTITEEDFDYVQFGDLLGDGIGATGNIILKESAKDQKYLKELFYHEASHAVFNCYHCSDSIMSTGPYLTDDDNWDEYVEKLFTTDFTRCSCI